MIMMVSLVSQTALADCKPSTDIYESYDYNPSKFVYTQECHIDYGRLRKVEPQREEQVKELKKSITMKDLALTTANDRIEVWQKTTYKLQGKLLTVEKNNDKLKWIYFGIGILTMSGAVWAAGQLKR